VAITAKFVGVFRHFFGVDELTLDYKEKVCINDLMIRLNEETLKTKQTPTGQFKEARSKALILVNDREISILNGLKTELKDGDEIVFIPFVHGG